MPNPVGDISKIHLPSGDEYNIKDTVSGYSKVFKINVTSSSNTYSADKTYSEIVSAYESSEYDIIIVSEINNSAAELGEYTAPLQTYDSTHGILTFICVCDESRGGSVASGNKNIVRKYQIEDDETVTVSESILPPFMTILSYGHNTWQDFLDAYNNNSIVYCRASSNSNPGSGSQTRMAFMAYVNASPPTEVEFQYYRSRNGHTDNYQGDQVYVYKINSSGTWSVTVRNTYTKMIAGKGLASTYANATVDSVASQGTLTFKTKLKSETALTNGAVTTTEVADRVYPVAVDKDGYLAVNVPWTSGSSGVTDVTVDGTSIVSSEGSADLITSASHPYSSSNPLATVGDVSAAGSGTVTAIVVAKGLTATKADGTPLDYPDLITSDGKIMHSNELTSAQTTQAVYPIKIDKYGHISAYGSAVTIPTVTDTYSSTGTDAISGKAVNAALQTLDSSITAETGKAISAITITDGKISANTKIAVGDANQNAFSNVKVGSSTIAADSTTDTLELAAGSNITLTPDTTNDKVTIAATDTDTTYSLSAGAVSHASGTSWEIRNTLTAGGSGSGTSTGGVTLLPGTNITLTGDTSASPNTITISASGGGSGTVTSVGLSNASGESDFTIASSPVTSSGTITIEHANSTTAKTSQAVYPITFDKHGHITGSGSAVTIPESLDDISYGSHLPEDFIDAISELYPGETDAAHAVLTVWDSVSNLPSNIVSSVGISNASNGGLTITGSPVTSSGTISVGHTNVLTSAQTTQAVYPIKIDKNGHISAYGSAVTIPTVYDGALKLQKNSGTATSLFTANQSGNSTLKFTTTSVGSASGWSAGTMASIDTSKFSGGSFTQGIDSFTANTPTVINTSKFSGGSFTSGAFTQGGLSMSGGGNAAASPSTLTISFTKPTHGSDSFTAASLASGFYSAGTAASFTQGTDQHTAASLGSGFYSAGTAPSLTVSSTTVVNDITNV